MSKAKKFRPRVRKPVFGLATKTFGLDKAIINFTADEEDLRGLEPHDFDLTMTIIPDNRFANKSGQLHPDYLQAGITEAVRQYVGHLMGYSWGKLGSIMIFFDTDGIGARVGKKTVFHVWGSKFKQERLELYINADVTQGKTDYVVMTTSQISWNQPRRRRPKRRK